MTTKENKGREYPAMVYSKDSHQVVQSEEEFAALKGKWYDSPADVPELKETAHPITGFVATPTTNSTPDEGKGELPEPIGPKATERDRLEYQAKSIDLKVQKSWTNEVLRRQIFEHGSA